jgi:uncharacterized protein YdaU (DUF1376 family)
MNDLPPPPVPAHADCRAFPYMPLDTERLLMSDLALTCSLEVLGAAVLLWAAAWHAVPAGSLPAEDAALAHLARAGARWHGIKGAALRGFVLCSDGRLYHPVVCEKVRNAMRAQARAEDERALDAARKRRARAARALKDAFARPPDVRGMSGGRHADVRSINRDSKNHESESVAIAARARVAPVPLLQSTVLPTDLEGLGKGRKP